MLSDRYGLAVSTTSAAARDAYVAGVDLLLAARAGAAAAFCEAIAHDEGFALAHAGLARAHQTYARAAEARPAIAYAQRLADGLPAREQSHVAMLGLLIEGRGAAALEAARTHLADHPRDAMVAAPCTGVFGLIGFSGRAGREAEQLAMLDGLADAYGDDWWFAGAHAFAQAEAGAVDRAKATIEQALAGNPRSANAAHIKSHIHYESGEREAGLQFLADWWQSYPKDSPLHCHLSWHIAIWQMELGYQERAWETYRAHLHPGGAWGPPINTLTDAASFLYRAEIAGGPRPDALWSDVSAYAERCFPNPGVAFADLHAALAHAFAGNGAALDRVLSDATGAVADLVCPLARGIAAFARGDWLETIAELRPVVDSHERVGGSRAQRDLIEFTFAAALLRSGQPEAAREFLATRRPILVAGRAPFAGL
jgi:tetratricopeptide (TPR) repeat protein